MPKKRLFWKETFLDKIPDTLLPNGLEISKFPLLEDRAVLHRKYKHQIKDFVRAYFFPYYQFDADNALIYFIAGRYELANKGIDVYIEALGKLNSALAKQKSKKEVIAFIWVPAKTTGLNKTLLENKILFDGIEDFVGSQLLDLKSEIVHSIVKQRIPSSKDLFSDSFRYNIKKKMFEFKKKGKVPITTHDLESQNDAIMTLLRKSGLNNSIKDRVKVIFYPAYLTGADGLLDLSYYDAITGCHLGVFPSYYEPWGYTPLETGALGVPFITTDLAGFGRYIQKDTKNSKGAMVLKREGRSRMQIVNDLTTYLHSFYKLSETQRISAKMQAKKIAESADWKNMISHYIKAHNLALSK